MFLKTKCLFQVAGTNTDGKSRYTDMIDRLYIFTHSFDLNLIFTDSVVDDNRDAIIGVLDNFNNEKFSHFKTNFNKVRLVFRTFVQGLSGGAKHSGFKAIMYPTSKLISVYCKNLPSEYQNHGSLLIKHISFDKSENV